MSNRYVVHTNLSSIWFHILDCEKDELVTHIHENKYKVMEEGTLSFSHRESAQYHCDKMNEALSD